MSDAIEVAGLHHGGMPIPAASRRGPLLVSGGISGLDRTTSTLPSSLGEQVGNVFANIAAIVDAAGGSTADIVRLTFTVGDRSARPLINERWVEMFPDPAHRPARHTIARELDGGMLVQAELTAFILPSVESSGT